MVLQENRLTRCDKILIAFAIIIAVISIVLINLFLYCGAAKGFLIEFDGKPYASYSFSELPREKTLEINTNIGYNIIRIADNTVEVVDASCHDGICEHKIISKPNQTIVCIPNKIVIKLVGNSQVDSVSY